MLRKKVVFNILMVMLVMLLVPITAFTGEVDRHASIIKVDETEIEADNDDFAEFTVYIRGGGNEEKVAPVYIASERGLITDSFWYEDKDGKWNEITEENTENFEEVTWNSNYIKLDNKSKYVFRVGSRVSGEATVAVGLTDVGGNNPYTYLTDSNITAAKAEIIGREIITFKATDAGSITLVNIKNRNEEPYTFLIKNNWGLKFTLAGDGKTISDEPNSNGSKPEYVTLTQYKNAYLANFEIDDKGTKLPSYPQKDYEYTYKLSINETATKFIKANGTDYYELTFALANNQGAPVGDKKMKFSLDSSKARLNTDEAESDEIGEVKVKVYALKTDTYELRAQVGSLDAKVLLDFSGNNVHSFLLERPLAQRIAIDIEDPDKFKIRFTDANGTPLKIKDLDLDNDLYIEWLELPDDADFDETFDEYSEWDAAGLVRPNEGDEVLKVFLPEMDTEGHYKLRLSLDSGNFLDFEWDALEQGDIVKIVFPYDAQSFPLDTISGPGELWRIDANGVISITNCTTPDIVLSVSNHTLLKNEWEAQSAATQGAKIKISNGSDIITNRLAPDNFNKFGGVLLPSQFITIDDDDYVGETLVVTCIDKKNNLVAEWPILIGNYLMGFDIQGLDTILLAGKENVLTFNMADKDGRPVSLGYNVGSVDFDYLIKSKPENATPTFDVEGRFTTDLSWSGATKLIAYSDVPGEVEATITLKVYNFNNELKYTFVKDVIFNFGEGSTTSVEYGAEKVTLFIGSTGYVADGITLNSDASPFIQDGRTFVPVRIVGEALGAEVEWDENSQTITLTRPDKTLSLTIGSTELKLADNTVLNCDAASFILNGRTFLPFRAIAEAFGAQVDTVLNTDGNIIGISFSQQ